jgi:hypothetical protein
MTTAGDLKKVTGEKDRTMKLSEDEAKVLIEMTLSDLEEIGHFIVILETLKSQPAMAKLVIKQLQDFVSILAKGKVAIVKMLLEKEKDARPSEVEPELIARWERIEDEIIKKGANDEQED